MYRDNRQWAHVRRRILEKGVPKKQVARESGISRQTINKMLRHEHPPGYGPNRQITQNWDLTFLQLIDDCKIPSRWRLI